MKAILINGRLKYQNAYDFIYNVDGNKITTIGATEEQWTGWGFKEVVAPVITDTQKLGDYYETPTEITRYIIDKTPEEIANDILQAEEQAQFELDTDIYAQQEDKYMEDGEMLYKRIKYEARRRLGNGLLVIGEYDIIMANLRPAILPLTTGDWDLAKVNVDLLPTNIGATLVEVLDWVKLQIDTYITDNY